LAIFSIFKRYSNRERKLRDYLTSHWRIKPKDIQWYENALRHKSLVGSGKFCHTDCNERLELLGDAVLDTVVTEYLFYKFPESNEGELTKIRARIVNREMLGKVGLNAGLGKAFEAWIGAIYLDLGFAEVKKCIEHVVLKKYIDIEAVVSQSTDFKSQLIEWTQQQKVQISFKTSQSTHDTFMFICEIHINGEFKSAGTERSKKRAEQIAAMEVCQTLGLT
jgi:ribonuclease-3